MGGVVLLEEEGTPVHEGQKIVPDLAHFVDDHSNDESLRFPLRLDWRNFIVQEDNIESPLLYIFEEVVVVGYWEPLFMQLLELGQVSRFQSSPNRYQVFLEDQPLLEEILDLRVILHLLLRKVGRKGVGDGASLFLARISDRRLHYCDIRLLLISADIHKLLFLSLLLLLFLRQFGVHVHRLISCLLVVVGPQVVKPPRTDFHDEVARNLDKKGATSK